MRIVILETREQLLTLITDNLDSEGNKNGFKILWPFVLSLGEPTETGDLPIRYTKWCPFTPLQEFQLRPESITSVAYPDDTILENYIQELETYGVPREKLFFEVDNGNQSEPAEATE